jgi:hypothetical protein
MSQENPLWGAPRIHGESAEGAATRAYHIHIHILEMNGESYRLKQSAGRGPGAGGGAKPGPTLADDPAAVQADNPSKPIPA